MGTPDEETHPADGDAVGRTGARFGSARARQRYDDTGPIPVVPPLDNDADATGGTDGAADGDDPDGIPDTPHVVRAGARYYTPKPKKRKKKKGEPEPNPAGGTPPPPEAEPPPEPAQPPAGHPDDVTPPAPPRGTRAPQRPPPRTERVFATTPQSEEDPFEDRLRVRPYVLTKGRTKARSDLNIETLISTDPRAHWDGEALGAEYQAVRRMCLQPRSVAEIAALLSVPLGVARVLLSDLAEQGLVQVHASKIPMGGRPDYDLMQRVLDGLHRL